MHTIMSTGNIRRLVKSFVQRSHLSSFLSLFTFLGFTGMEVRGQIGEPAEEPLTDSIRVIGRADSTGSTTLSDTIDNSWKPFVPASTRTVKITPGERYDRGGLHRMFFGDLWRDAWGTEMEVPVLDISGTEGGLKPTEKGGGNQTTSLRFESSDGREFKFRSVDKDPSSVLDKPLRKTFVRNIMQDMISTQNPAGALIAEPLHDAVDIPNAHAYMLVMPDDPQLGEFREEFAGMLGTMEEHPNEGPDDTPGFMGYGKIIGSEELYEKIREDNDDQVLYADYLKVRLVDMLIGDWDRHMDQYRWGEVEMGGLNFWRPIPRDRDMAFSRYDGLIPWWAEQNFPEIEGTEENYPNIEDLTWAGKTLDRRFLIPIERSAWDSVTRFVQSRITDSVITVAVARMPLEVGPEELGWLRTVIRARLDKLDEASDELYELVMQQPELWGSEKDEYVEIDRVDDERVTVTIYKRDKEKGEKGELLLQHTFSSDYTDEIRLMLLDGDDKVVLRGEVGSSITVKIDGGDGADEYVDESKVRGFLLDILPIPDAETSTYIYDSGKKTQITPGPGTVYNDDEFPEWDNDTAAWMPPYRDYGDDWRWTPWLSYDSDDGLFVGLRPSLTVYGFREEPYASEMTFGVGYAFGSQAFKADFTGDFRAALPNARVKVNLWASELEILNYFGLGNNTPFDQGLDDAGFYDISQRQFLARVDVQVPEESSFRAYIGAEGTYTRTKLSLSPILDSLRPYGVDPTALVAGRAGVVFDTRDVARAPSKGVYVTLNGKYTPELLDNRSAYVTTEVDARTYLTFGFPQRTTLALRVAGKKIFSDSAAFPYFEAAYLGGKKSLRGYESDRFAGDMAILGASELRVQLFRHNLIAPGAVGITGLAEIGRVYLEGETSDEWHHTYGGGLFFSFVEPHNVLVLSVTQSEERDFGLFVKFGHAF